LVYIEYFQAAFRITGHHSS